jgi:hypothetical protein
MSEANFLSYCPNYLGLDLQKANNIQTNDFFSGYMHIHLTKSREKTQRDRYFDIQIRKEIMVNGKKLHASLNQVVHVDAFKRCMIRKIIPK